MAAHSKNKNVLLIDNISPTRPPIRVGEHKGSITKILSDSECTMLLVGDYSGRLVQYGLTQGAARFKVVKDHGRLGIGRIISSTRVGHLVVIGGRNPFLRVVDMRRRILMQGTFLTAIGCVYSLEFSVLSNSQIVLLVSRRYADYSQSCTDLLDFSKLLKNLNVSVCCD